MSIASSSSYASYLASHNENPYHLNHIYEFTELSKRIAIEQINDIVPNMIKDICRSSIKEYIQRKDILLNYDYLKEMDYKLKDGDVFSIRKIGKYQFHGILRMTKANHYVVELYRYL